jgi:hypothetical protein
MAACLGPLHAAKGVEAGPPTQRTFKGVVQRTLAGWYALSHSRALPAASQGGHDHDLLGSRWRRPVKRAVVRKSR